MRRVIAFLHRWMGLIVALYFCMLGWSGALLVAAPMLFAMEHGIAARPMERAAENYISPDLWLSKAEARYGKLPAIESYNAPLATPMRIAAPTMVYSTVHEGRDANGVIVADPYSGEPRAHFIAQASWSLLPLILHMGLFLPYTLLWTVLIVAAWLLLALALSGLVAWWPRRAQAKQSLTPAAPRSPGEARRLHSTLGAWSVLPLLILALSGLMMADEQLGQSVASVLGRAPVAINEASCTGGVVTPGDALDRVKRLLPSHELATLDVPSQPGGVYDITLRPKGSTMPVRGDAAAILSACGDAILLRQPADNAGGDALLAHIVDIHSGRAAGWMGQLLVFATGLLLGLLPLLGIVAWAWRHTRRHMRSRASASP